MFPIAPAKSGASQRQTPRFSFQLLALALPLGLAAAARADPPLAKIRLAEIRFAEAPLAAPDPLAKECFLALSHLVALLLRWTPSPA